MNSLMHVQFNRIQSVCVCVNVVGAYGESHSHTVLLGPATHIVDAHRVGAVVLSGCGPGVTLPLRYL